MPDLNTLASILLVLAACAPWIGCAASPWTITVDEQQGLPVLHAGGARALWGMFGAWEDRRFIPHRPGEFKVLSPFHYTAATRGSGSNDGEILSRISKPSDRRLAWEFVLNAGTSAPGGPGAGIIFRFDLAAFGTELGQPELLDGNRGWAWGKKDGRRIVMRFDPPLPDIRLEHGRQSELKVLLRKSAGRPEQRRYSAMLTISGDVEIARSVPERFGLDDQGKWPADILDWANSPVDLSFLNAREKPAGKRGFLTTQQNKLVFQDGTPARFWGTNLTANTLFGTSRESVKRQARRMSQLGFNIARLHHHDSPWVRPNVFGDPAATDTRSLSPAMLDHLDWWIKCLKDEGIYVWLDLHVQRYVKPGDGIVGFEEIAKGSISADIKGYNYVNASIRQAMRAFNENYVNHRNSYTGLRYKDDPAIVAMLLTNENDITHHFVAVFHPDNRAPTHRALYMNEAKAFAASRGLSSRQTSRSWEQGPSKFFLNDLERRFNVEMIDHLRAQGVRVPIATTSTWGSNPLSSLPALTAGDIIDAHAYGTTGEIERNPLYGPNLVHWLAAAQIAGRPVSVTEWNVSPFPIPDRHSVPLYLAASASHQGWSALMQYAYSQVPPNGPGRPSNWHAFNDPALLASLPAAALLYRQHHVREAATVYAFSPDKHQLFGQYISPKNSVALRTASERGKLVIVLPGAAELPWLEKSTVPAGARILTDPEKSLIDAAADEAISDTGELRRNWTHGVYRIDTPRTQAATGWIGGQRIVLQDVEIEAATRNATVAVQSLDDHAISNARAILISLGARSVPKSPEQLPFRSEPVEGHLTIRARKGLRLYTGRPAGGERTHPAPYVNGRYHIELVRDLATYWLVLK